MNNDIKLGMELEKLKHDYRYEQIANFLKGKSESCMYLDRVKPLYDEYGYELVNRTILDIEREKPKKESRPLVKEECETR